MNRIYNILSQLLLLYIGLIFFLEKFKMGVLKIKPYGWYFSNRTLQFSRLITNTSVLPSLFIGVITIWLSVYVSKNEGNIVHLPYDFMLEVNQFNWITLIILFIIAVIGGRYFFKKQTPEQYSQFSIDGREAKDALMYTSYLIWKECAFVKSHRNLYSKLDALINAKGVVNVSKWKASTIIYVRAFNKSVDKRLENQEIIRYALERLSNSLNIPIVRLSDYFFQFNPHIFTSEFRRVSNALEEICLTRKDTASNNCNIQEKRASKVKDFFDIILMLKGFQESIIKHSDLHNFIIGMSDTNGASSALRTYALGFNTILNSNGNDNDKFDKIKFLFHKRRMYPGFDTHISLMNLARLEDLNTATNNTKVEASLKKIYSLNSTKLKATDENAEISKELGNIMSIVDEYISLQRRNLCINFKKYIKREFLDSETPNHRGKIVFLTQGFSTVVNSTIISVLRDFKKEKVLEKIDFRIFLLVDDEDVKNNFEKTRYVRYNFKMNPNLLKDLGGQVMVKAGNFDWLSKRYDKEENRILMLSGAEFFQEDTREKFGYRLINNEKSEDVIEEEMKKLNNNIYRHIILAEDYKKFDRNISDQEVYKDALSRDHLEYLNLYKWREDRVIITGTKIHEKQISRDSYASTSKKTSGNKSKPE
ncbi:hypothetical protein [Flavivirga eckloniae]|uniref:Uncharacterized protein n=1 Tax=Flavivirga eckloniae TaxID=1803846 RepID=A0A2K9PKJ9_9FLAO|nr:hypothetical protein [Flavivirga eckloniae]AUP77591.1 hypothetical protein C1H87_02200 [Flavivirga eckloniae]